MIGLLEILSVHSFHFLLALFVKAFFLLSFISLQFFLHYFLLVLLFIIFSFGSCKYSLRLFLRNSHFACFEELLSKIGSLCVSFYGLALFSVSKIESIQIFKELVLSISIFVYLGLRFPSIQPLLITNYPKNCFLCVIPSPCQPNGNGPLLVVSLFLISFKRIKCLVVNKYY